jgi:hypothetical protein
MADDLWTDKLDMLPERCREGIRRWIEEGILPGSFLRAVLSNDFMAAVCRADDFNRPHLVDFAHFLHGYAPSGCFGSPDVLQTWRGLGRAREVAP